MLARDKKINKYVAYIFYEYFWTTSSYDLNTESIV